MKKTSILKRMLISVLAIAMVLTAIPMTTVTAQAAPTAVKKVVIKQGKKNVTKKTIKLAVGKSSKIKVVVKPSKAKKSIKYVSGNKKVATVSKSGKIKAKAAGTTKIKVTVTGKNKKKKTTWVKVKVTGGKTEDTPSPQPSNSPAPSQAPAPQPSVAPTPQSAPAMVNGSVRLPITNAVSSDPSIATVDATGKVTAGTKAGTVTITGKDASGNDVSYTVTVTQADIDTVNTSINIVLDKTVINISETAKVTAVVVPSNAEIKYSSSNETVATVAQDGTVLGIGVGKATITATANGKSVSTEIEVKAIPVESISLDLTEVKDLKEGRTVPVKATVLPANASNKAIEWKSQDENIAKVIANGTSCSIEGVAKGTTTITATSMDGSGKVATCTVNVTQNEVAVDGIKLSVEGALKDKDGNTYRDRTTVLGSSLTVRAVVTSGQQKASNETVEMKLDPISGNEDLSLFKVRVKGSQNAITLVQNSNKISGETNDKGEIEFIVESTRDENKSEDDVLLQSFKATVSSAVANNVEYETTSIGFGTILVDNVELLSDLEPSTNASWRNNGYYNVKKGKINIDYVTSQQYSDESRDHSVEFSSIPTFYMPYYEISDEDTENKKIDKETGVTTLYNPDSNATTTVIQQVIPTGTSSIGLNFSKIALSKFTLLHVDVKDENGKTYANENYEPDKNSLEKSTISITNINNETSAVMTLYVVSKGQVNSNNQGCALESIDITRVKDLSGQDYYEWTPMSNVIDWSIIGKDTIKYVSESSYDKISPYLPTDKGYEKDGFTYSMKYPAYPYVGNAIITVTNNASQHADYYSIPTQLNDAGDSSVVGNTNYRVKITKEEAEKNVGSIIEQDGNIVRVDSNSVGTTYLKANLNIKGVELGNSSVLYTAIEWATLPEEAEKIESEDFYAIKGQSIKVDLKLLDSTGIPETGEIQISYEDKSDGLKILDTVKTDDEGMYSYSIKATELDSYVEMIRFDAVEQGYKVDVTIADENLGVSTSKNPKYANLYWIDLGLAFASEAKNEWETNFGLKETTYGYASDFEIGDDVWNVQFLPVAKNTQIFDCNPGENRTTNEFIDVTNIPVLYSITGNSNATLSSKKDENGKDVATLQCSNTKSSMENEADATTIHATLKLNNANNLSNVEFVFYNNEGEKVTAKNAGVGSIETAPQMAHVINWINDNVVNTELIAANGVSVPKSDGFSYVYVKVTDSKGNPRVNAELESVETSGGYAYVDDQQLADSKGMIALKVYVPENVTSQTMTVKVKGGKETSIDLYYTDEEEPFGIVENGINYNSDNKTIVVKASRQISLKTVAVNDQIVIKNSNGIVVAAVKSVSYSADTILIELKETLPVDSTYTLSIVPAKDSQGIIRSIVDNNGMAIAAEDVAFKLD